MKALGLGAVCLLGTTQCQGVTEPDPAGTVSPLVAYSNCFGDGTALGWAGTEVTGL